MSQCPRCKSEKMSVCDDGYLLCARCGAIVEARINRSRIQGELPTADEMTQCPRGT